MNEIRNKTLQKNIWNNYRAPSGRLIPKTSFWKPWLRNLCLRVLSPETLRLQGFSAFSDAMTTCILVGNGLRHAGRRFWKWPRQKIIGTPFLGKPPCQGKIQVGEGPFQQKKVYRYFKRGTSRKPKKQPNIEHQVPRGAEEIPSFFLRKASCCQPTHARPDIIWSAYIRTAKNWNPRSTVKTEVSSIWGNLPLRGVLRGLCGGPFEGSAWLSGVLRGSMGISVGSDPMLVTLRNCWSFASKKQTAFERMTRTVFEQRKDRFRTLQHARAHTHTSLYLSLPLSLSLSLHLLLCDSIFLALFWSPPLSPLVLLATDATSLNKFKLDLNMERLLRVMRHNAAINACN